MSSARSEAGQPKPGPATNVTININFPKLHAPKIRLPKQKPQLPNLPYKLIGKRLASVAVVLVCAFIVYSVINHVEGNKRKVVAEPGHTALAAPTFQPVVPKDKPDLANPANNQKAAFDGNRDVYSFQDTLLGTQLIVSEQSLPSKFSSGEQAVSQIGGSMGAKDSVNNSAGPALLKTDAKSGSQTIVASIKGLLIFIQSPFRHSTADWKTYLENLN